MLLTDQYPLSLLGFNTIRESEGSEVLIQLSICIYMHYWHSKINHHIEAYNVSLLVQCVHNGLKGWHDMILHTYGMPGRMRNQPHANREVRWRREMSRRRKTNPRFLQHVSINYIVHVCTYWNNYIEMSLETSSFLISSTANKTWWVMMIGPWMKKSLCFLSIQIMALQTLFHLIHDHL